MKMKENEYRVAEESIKQFRERHFKIVSPKQIFLENYEVGCLKLMNNTTNHYSVTLLVNRTGELLSPDDYLEELHRNLPNQDVLEFWIRINSFYRQLRETNRIKNLEAIRFLGDLQIRLSTIGAEHLTYDEHVVTKYRFLIPKEIFVCDDIELKDKNVKAYSFVPNLLKGIVFDPNTHYELLKVNEKEGKINFQVNSPNLVEIVID